VGIAIVSSDAIETKPNYQVRGIIIDRESVSTLKPVVTGALVAKFSIAFAPSKPI